MIKTRIPATLVAAAVAGLLDCVQWRGRGRRDREYRAGEDRCACRRESLRGACEAARLGWRVGTDALRAPER